VQAPMAPGWRSDSAPDLTPDPCALA
jgi:hypothetical protein